MIKKHLDKILIFLGIIIIIIAIILKLNTQYQQKKLINDYKKNISNMEDEDKSFNEEKDKPQNEQKNESQIKENGNESGNIIGILNIPKLDLSVGIGEGVDTETLKYSVGHFTDTAMPGRKGNLCIVGHRSYAYGEFFNRLDELEKDDYITIESYGHTFKYKVTGTEVVLPSEISVLNQTEDSEITLITCTPIRVASHRLIVKGILVDGEILN